MTELDLIDQFMLDIQADKYKPNDKLPSENQVADYYRIPRITVRKAYERLQEMGYIYSQQGKGRYLKNRQEQIDLALSGDVSFSKKMEDMGYEVTTRNIFCVEMDYDEKIYNFLGIDHSDRVFKVGRLRIIENKPIALHISYVAKSLFADIDIVGTNITSMFAYYNSKGYYHFSSSKSILSVSFPTKYEQKILKCPNLIPLLILKTDCLAKETKVVLEYSKIIYRTDCFNYVIHDR